MQRKVYRMVKAGSINDLRMLSEPLQDPAEGEVTINVRAIGLNFADIFAIQGLYKAAPKEMFIPGLEFSGEVLSVGRNAGSWKVGDRVMGATRFGGYVTHLNIDHRYVVPLPENWSYEQGAGFIVQGLTAWYALTELGNLKEGMTVLIHSAAGGVGILANRICKTMGAHTIGTVGNPGKVDFLKEHEKYDSIIVRDRNFYHNLITALDGRELKIVMDCIGGKILMEGWKAMAPTGRLIAYGSASFATHSSRPDYIRMIWRYLQRPKIDPLRLPTQNKSLMGFNLIYLYERTDLMLAMLNDLFSLNLSPQHIGHVFAFPDMLKAIKLFQSGKSTGKVVVTC